MTSAWASTVLPSDCTGKAVHGSVSPVALASCAERAQKKMRTLSHFFLNSWPQRGIMLSHWPCHVVMPASHHAVAPAQGSRQFSSAWSARYLLVAHEADNTTRQVQRQPPADLGTKCQVQYPGLTSGCRDGPRRHKKNAGRGSGAYL